MDNFRITKRDGRLRQLGHLVNEYLAEGGLTQRSLSSLCAELWPQVVGPWYARNTRVIGLKNKELAVWCDTPALAQQLQYDQVKIIGRLNDRLRAEIITSLRPASVGPQRQRHTLLQPPDETVGVTATDLDGVALTTADHEFLERAAGIIPDPELRERFARSLERELRLRHWKVARGWRPCVACEELHNELGHERCFICRIEAQEPPRQGSDEVLEPWRPRSPG